MKLVPDILKTDNAATALCESRDKWVIGPSSLPEISYVPVLRSASNS